MFFYSLINMAVIQSRPRDAKPLHSPLSPRCQILSVTSTGPFVRMEELPRSDPTAPRQDKKRGGSEKDKKSSTKIVTQDYRCLLPFLLADSQGTWSRRTWSILVSVRTPQRSGPECSGGIRQEPVYH